MSNKNERFVLNRDLLHAATSGEGIQWDGRVVGRAVSAAFADAVDAAAIGGIDGLEVEVYAVNDSVLVTVRETNLIGRTRSIASPLIEVKAIAEWGESSFEEMRAAINALLERANNLVPKLRLLQAAEAQQ